jgi:hypothetical protein
VTSDALAHARLAHQRIGAPRRGSLGALVADLGAVQAQDYAGAKWSLGLRAAGATDADVERALAGREIVRTWPMRGTLHFVAADDARWLLALLGPRALAAAAKRHRDLGLDAATIGRARDAWTAALAGGGQLTRDEMYAALEAAKLSTEGQRGYHLLWRLAHDGVLCFGAVRGKQQTFALLDEWVPASRAMARDESLAEVARRYFATRGPATVKDLAWWTGLTGGDARKALDMVRGELEAAVVDGVTYWSGDGPAAAVAGVAHLAPGFDEYLLAYCDRSAVVEDRYAKRLHAGGGVFSPAVVVDGRVAGTWRRTVKRAAVLVEATPFARWTKADRAAVTAAAGRYAAFVGLPLELEFVGAATP